MQSQLDIKTNLPKKQRRPHRWVENSHILLWLMKDTCWATLWRPGGIFMIAPTLGMAIYILWITKDNRADAFHNLAICLWISANSVWMFGEFFNKEKTTKPIAIFIFFMGLGLLSVYYILYFNKDRKKETLAMEPSII